MTTEENSLYSPPRPNNLVGKVCVSSPETRVGVGLNPTQGRLSESVQCFDIDISQLHGQLIHWLVAILCV